MHSRSSLAIQTKHPRCFLLARLRLHPRNPLRATIRAVSSLWGERSGRDRSYLKRRGAIHHGDCTGHQASTCYLQVLYSWSVSYKVAIVSNAKRCAHLLRCSQFRGSGGIGRHSAKRGGFSYLYRGDEEGQALFDLCVLGTLIKKGAVIPGGLMCAEK